MNIDLEVIVYWIGVFGIILLAAVGAGFFLIDVFNKKRRARIKELDEEEERLATMLKSRVELLEKQVNELNSKLIETNTKFQETLIQNKAYKDILLGTDEDTKRYRAEVRVVMGQIKASFEITKQNARRLGILKREIDGLVTLTRSHIQHTESMQRLNLNKQKEGGSDG